MGEPDTDVTQIVTARAAVEADMDVGQTLAPPPPDVARTLAPPTSEDTRPTDKITTKLPPPGDIPSPETISDLDRVSALSRLRGGSTQRYQIDREIGRGGMGRVLRVQDSDLNRQVAMKTLLGHGDEQVLRFIEEAQISSQLQHPSVLPVHDFGIDGNGDFFFTMQLIEGSESLRDVITKLQAGDREYFQRYSFEARVQVIQRVCQALHYAHERGVVHRDIKPDNIVVGLHGEVWLVDWGVAQIASLAEEHTTVSQISLGTTNEGTMSAAPLEPGAWVGTPRYMAPEQILGFTNEIDALTDVYAVAAVLYEFLTLRHYLGDRGNTISDLLGAIPGDTPRDAEDWTHPLNGRVPRHLSRYCRKGLSKAKEARYPSAVALERDLQDWLEGNSPIVCPGTAMQRGLRRYSDLIDAAPVLVPALTIIMGILVGAWVVLATVLTISNRL